VDLDDLLNFVDLIVGALDDLVEGAFDDLVLMHGVLAPLKLLVMFLDLTTPPEAIATTKAVTKIAATVSLPRLLLKILLKIPYALSASAT
jgi:hypothetical protein